MSRGKVVAYVDHVNYIRTSECEIASHSLKCPACTSYRSNLLSMHHRCVKQSRSETGESSYQRVQCLENTSDSYLNTPEKVHKRVSKKLRNYVRNVLVRDLHSDLVSIMNENSDGIKDLRVALQDSSGMSNLKQQQLVITGKFDGTLSSS